MLFKFIEETLHTLSVTTYQPVGWSFNKVQERIRTAVVRNPAEAQQEQSCPVVFVHGIFHNASAFYRLEKKCKRHGFKNVRTIELWTSLQSLHAMAQQLHAEVERAYLAHRRFSKDGKVRIVGHSLGGMVVRTALLNENFAAMVDKIIFLGTPHQGSKLYELPFPPCLKDLAQESTLLKRLKTEPLPGGIEYWNLRGRLDVVVPGKRTLLPGVPNLIFDDIGHAGLLSNPKVANCLITLLEDISERSDSAASVFEPQYESSPGARMGPEPQIHFVTGKGGVGKSSVAAALASRLEKLGQGPVLLLEVQGSGHSLELLKVEQIQFNNTHVPGHTNLWAARILPKESFKQYFGVLLGMGGQSTLALATHLFKERIVDIVVENKIVSAFIDVCPGLEPAVLLGKIHWEATQGCTPEEKVPWRHVVVDAPATGHGVMLFKSTFALSEVFSRGVFFRAATGIKDFVRSPKNFHIYLVSTPEELPLRESLEMIAALKILELPRPAIVINRFTATDVQPQEVGSRVKTDPEWQREIDFERESILESTELLENFYKDLAPETKKYFLPEIIRIDNESFLSELRDQLGKQMP